MTLPANKPTTYGNLDSHKRQWLSTMGLAGDKSVIDCDITARRITQLVDGEPRVRQLVETYSRVMGYHRPVTEWNHGKKQEYADRKMYKEEKCISHLQD